VTQINTINIELVIFSICGVIKLFEIIFTICQPLFTFESSNYLI